MVLIGHQAYYVLKAEICWTDLCRILYQLSGCKINDVRYNESAARTCTLREEKWSSMSFTLWVRIMHKIATDIQQWFGPYKNWYLYHTQYIMYIWSIYTLPQLTCFVVLSRQSSPVSVQQLCHHSDSPPDSSVCGWALWRRGRHPVSYWSVEREEGNRRRYCTRVWRWIT